MADGTYDEILKKWDLLDAKLDKVMINGGANK
jgi:hypothetical protein